MVGITNYGIAFDSINGAKLVDGLDLRKVINIERKIILTAVAHELLEFSLALGHGCAAEDSGTKEEYKTIKLHYNEKV